MAATRSWGAETRSGFRRTATSSAPITWDHLFTRAIIRVCSRGSPARSRFPVARSSTQKPSPPPTASLLDVFSVQDAVRRPFGDVARVGACARPSRRRWPAKLHRVPSSPRDRPRSAPALFAYVASCISTTSSLQLRSCEVEEVRHARGNCYTRSLWALFGNPAFRFPLSAIVSTHGERAMDVFCVRDGFGHKVVHPTRLKAVEEGLIRALSKASPLKPPPRPGR